MGTEGVAGPTPRSRRGRVAAGVVGAGLLAVVVLARGGTAATPDDLAVGSEPSPTAEPSAARQDRVDLDGVADVRLGAGPALGDGGGTTGGWDEVGRSDDGRCRLLRPGLPPDGLDVTAWVVDDVVESVAMTAPGAMTEVRTSFGVDFGDDLAAAALLPGAVRRAAEVPGAGVGAIGWVVAELDGVEVVASDLGGDVGIQHLEVRTSKGSGCRTGRPWGGALAEDPPPGGTPAGELPGDPPVDPLPVLDAVGRAPVRYGQPVAELPAVGLEEVGAFIAYSGCHMWLPVPERSTPLAGLEAVWVRDGHVAGIGIASGSLVEGFEVGEGVEELLAAFPELRTDLVNPIDPGGRPLLPPFPMVLRDGRTIHVQLLDTYVVPDEVDALLVTDRPLVRAVTVWVDRCE